MAEDSSQIREAIIETRSEIAGTMQALGQKADVKGRLGEVVDEKAQELKSRAAALQEQARSKLPESVQPKADAAIESAQRAASTVAEDPAKKRAAAIAAGLVVLSVLIRRRRRRKRG